ncbi:hypothetical protein BDV26DRAFT_274624 [Aspergillus bertholletiae]|uniref:Uncharacterized protein n=1 Tax=Aspergillus bertholletiae TaxID=1226010 RepID=A0A5N7AQN5_9EURO|nr:hypothetical protein BDV26DRAFT_274624 [Aspergillus bertholletiae]
MELKKEIRSRGSTTVRIGNWVKEADESWVLTTNNSPITTTLEIGLSESSQKLATDARGWLETNGTTVQVALTMAINRSRPQVVINRYELSPPQSITRTRASRSVACCVETINITRGNNTTAASGGLTIPFKKFTGRDMNPNNPLERDLFIPDYKLGELAEVVWEPQGFV